MLLGRSLRSPFFVPFLLRDMSQSHHVFVFLEIFSCEGGIQSYVKDILQAYSRLEAAQADVFLLRDQPEIHNPFASSSNLRFHYCQPKLAPQSATIGRLKLAIALFTHLLKHRPQRVFCGHVYLAPLVQILCQFFRIPYTVLTYGKEVWEPLPPRKQTALQHADRIWTISRYSRDRACDANGIDPTRVDFLYCAVDGSVFRPHAKDPALLEHYGLEDAKVLMTVARLWSGDPYKGVDITIRAVPAIAQVFPNVKYLVIGRGDDQPRLARLAKELGVHDRVVFAGFVATEDLPKHYNLADAYVMPSQEGFGIVYLEALACGVPVLSGDADGSADPLQDGRFGWRVPYRDSIAVAEACIEILKGEDQRCQGEWLRQESLAIFDKPAFEWNVRTLVNDP